MICLLTLEKLWVGAKPRWYWQLSKITSLRDLMLFDLSAKGLPIYLRCDECNEYAAVWYESSSEENTKAEGTPRSRSTLVPRTSLLYEFPVESSALRPRGRN